MLYEGSDRRDPVKDPRFGRTHQACDILGGRASGTDNNRRYRQDRRDRDRRWRQTACLTVKLRGWISISKGGKKISPRTGVSWPDDYYHATVQYHQSGRAGRPTGRTLPRA
jgi:hypothetical protein